jgi:ArsR family transcriptional regulator
MQGVDLALARLQRYPEPTPVGTSETEKNAMPLPVINQDMSEAELDQIATKACDAANFLKAISHEGRLMILCHLVTGEKSVTELEDLLSARQAAVSQQLARLRLEGLVTPRREGKTIYYSLRDDRPRKVLEVIYDLFCAESD